MAPELTPEVPGGASPESMPPELEVPHETPWERAAPRVAQYLRALGVRDSRDADLLMSQVRERFERTLARGPIGDPLETGIEEVTHLLDAWLLTELGAEASVPALRAARSLVLSGAIPGWVGVWSGRMVQADAAAAPTSAGARIRSVRLSPVPDPAPLAMPTQRIDPCCYRLFRRARLVLRALGFSSARRSAGAGRSMQ
jgi:hypothetical protein